MAISCRKDSKFLANWSPTLLSSTQLSPRHACRAILGAQNHWAAATHQV